MPGETHEVAASSSGYDDGRAGTGLAGDASEQSAGRPGGAGGRVRRRRAEVAFLLAPVVAAVAANSYELARPSLWRDEAYTIDAAHRSFPQIFTLLTHTDAVNSTYYLLMHPVIVLLGTSAAAVRLPSVLAMAVAAMMTAVLGRRLARAAALPGPAVTGLVAAGVLVVLPQATRYAQEARAYALVAMFATIATYLLLRALERGGARWWAGYGAAVVAMGLLNLLSLALVGAHAVTLALLWARQRRGDPAAWEPTPGQPRRVQTRAWLAAVGGALVVLSPLIAIGMSQSKQISWLKRPGLPAINALVTSFAGSKTMLPLVALLALGGVAASFAPRRRGGPLDLALVAAPWLILPPVALLAVSQVHPLYDSRYVIYCLPALALLVAGGLSWLTKLVMTTSLAARDARLAWVPAVALLAAFAALAVGPQRSVRLPASRPDNLRYASAVVAANERPGDAVLYLPANKRVVSMGYPAPFRGLWDVALAKSPVAAGNLIGSEVSIPVLRQRFGRVSRVWVISGGLHIVSAPKSASEKAKVALLASFHLVRTWRAGAIDLSLYARG